MDKELVDSSAPKPSQAKKQRIYLRAGLGLVVPALLVTVWVVIAMNQKHYFPKDIRRQTNTALYYPIKPPAGMSVDRSSFMVPKKNVVTYKVSDSEGNAFYIAIQNIPTHFDFAAFKNHFARTEQFSTQVGDALFGDANSVFLVSIPTSNQSWIIINTQAFTKQTELENLARSLVQTK